MNRIIARIALPVALSLFAFANSARADDIDFDYRATPEAMLIDAVAIRPLGIVATVVGAATWVVALPFTIPTRSVGYSAQALVVGPFRHTFVRPLGDSGR